MDMKAMLGRQTVMWRPCIGRDARDERAYGEQVEITGRAVLVQHDLIDAKGEVTTSQMTVQLLPCPAPAVDDLLNGRQVIALTQQTTFDGTPVGWLVMTR